jgi:hypothetical protein
MPRFTSGYVDEPFPIPAPSADARRAERSAGDGDPSADEADVATASDHEDPGAAPSGVAPVGAGYASVDYASRAYVARDPGSELCASVDYASRHYPATDFGESPDLGHADGDTWRLQGEGAFGQGVHVGSPWGIPAGYPDRYPDEASMSPELLDDPDYLKWRAEQVRRLDDDYRTWRQGRDAAKRR